MSRLIRPISLALALLVLCSSAMYASPSSGRLTQEGFLAALWNRVVAWLAPSAPVSVQEKAGSQMDPDGILSIDIEGSRYETDAGSQMDPDGNK
jgi:hypothetical protein